MLTYKFVEICSTPLPLRHCDFKEIIDSTHIIYIIYAMLGDKICWARKPCLNHVFFNASMQSPYMSTISGKVYINVSSPYNVIKLVVIIVFRVFLQASLLVHCPYDLLYYYHVGNNCYVKVSLIHCSCWNSLSSPIFRWHIYSFLVVYRLSCFYSWFEYNLIIW